jgi:hypothetical protein
MMTTLLNLFSETSSYDNTPIKLVKIPNTGYFTPQNAVILGFRLRIAKMSNVFRRKNP